MTWPCYLSTYNLSSLQNILQEINMENLAVHEKWRFLFSHFSLCMSVLTATIERQRASLLFTFLFIVKHVVHP